jgi:hypothetical protein
MTATWSLRLVIQFRCCANVGALALFPDQAEEFDGAGAGGAEPVRGEGVELRGFASREHEVGFAENETERAVEDVDPVVAFVCTQVRLLFILSRREDELVGLDSSRPPRERQDRRPVCPRDGSQVDARVAGWWRIHELVEGDPVHAGEWKQLFQRGSCGSL